MLARIRTVYQLYKQGTINIIAYVIKYILLHIDIATLFVVQVKLKLYSSLPMDELKTIVSTYNK